LAAHKESRSADVSLAVPWTIPGTLVVQDSLEKSKDDNFLKSKGVEAFLWRLTRSKESLSVDFSLAVYWAITVMLVVRVHLRRERTTSF
jgi:hypothetical protein